MIKTKERIAPKGFTEENWMFHGKEQQFKVFKVKCPEWVEYKKKIVIDLPNGKKGIEYKKVKEFKDVYLQVFKLETYRYDPIAIQKWHDMDEYKKSLYRHKTKYVIFPRKENGERVKRYINLSDYDSN